MVGAGIVEVRAAVRAMVDFLRTILQVAAIVSGASFGVGLFVLGGFVLYGLGIRPLRPRPGHR